MESDDYTVNGLLGAYTKVYIEAMRANVSLQQTRSDKEGMAQVRLSGRRCVEHFRETIKDLPEFKALFDRPATPSNLSDNTEAGKF